MATTTVDVYRLPNPPNGGPGGGPPAPKMQDMYDSLQAFAKENGFAIVRRQGRNSRKVDQDTKVITTYTISCNQDQKRPSKGLGKRNVKSMKKDCPWHGVLKSRSSSNWHWFFEIDEDQHHNHPASDDPGAHAIHRRLQDVHKGYIAGLVAAGVKPAVIFEALKRTYPDHAFEKSDINNETAALRKKQTPTLAQITQNMQQK
ncbi:hypothetical protein F5Y18DRAFT_397765 [Xylariaceae sp. FL1019]|nr:hypothetical protein F5Y18DRAFT_397765 [Xylariaceae sp. FL1019]